ncbi:MAG: hypothetical protein KDF64_00015 [Geminicoccaceae bacterium]|nr:hypothetical protein [Geminicoccaceae bacterium]
MVPLITQEIYDRFSTLRRQMASYSPAHVFVPVGGENADLRILFVGKATRGWADPSLATFSKSFARAEVLAKENPPANQFRGFARTITKDALRTLEIPVENERLHEHIGWSNLAKIGAANGNPSSHSLDVQVKLCIESLIYEVDRFRPTAIILATADFASDKIVNPAIERIAPGDWKFYDPGGCLAVYKEHKADRPAIVWTNHPERMRRENRIDVEQLSVRLIVDANRFREKLS